MPSAIHEVRCKTCLSLLYWISRDGTHVRVPIRVTRRRAVAQAHGAHVVGSKAPWHEILDDLPQHDEYAWA